MARGSDARAQLLWQRYISHLWNVERITGTQDRLVLHLDGSNSLDRPCGRHHDQLDMAMSTLGLYLREHGPDHFVGHAKEFLLKHGLATQAQFDKLDETHQAVRAETHET